MLLAYCRLLFGVNEKWLTQHILGPVTKYKLATRGRALSVGRVRARTLSFADLAKFRDHLHRRPLFILLRKAGVFPT